jgi:hypothetical protein
MNERYNVVLEGGVRPEASREAVIPDLAALVGRDPQFARELLSGQSVTLRSNVPQAEADDALAALLRIGVLARVERAPDLAIDADLDARLHQRSRPALWNPNAAACWSLLFTPVFGSWLQLYNWRALNRPDRTGPARAWLLASMIVFLVTFVVSLLIQSSGNALRGFNFVYLLVWYFASGRSQATYVRREFGKDYPRQGWWRPLLIAVAVVIATMILSNIYEDVVGEVVIDGSPATRL